MNLTLIDAAIKGYASSLDEGDNARLALFRGIWGILAKYERLVASKASYELPELSTLDAWYWAPEPIFSQLPPTIYRDGLVVCSKELAAYFVQNASLPEEACALLRDCDWEALTRLAPLDLAASHPSAWLDAIAAKLQETQQQEVGPSDDQGADSSSPADAAIPDMRAMVLSLALRSQLSSASATIRSALDAMVQEEIRVHKKSTNCPCCGTEATIAYVGPTPASAGNARRLWCAQCGMVWDFERVRCARCGISDARKLRYFSLAGDSAHRIHLCDECGGYIRTVFTNRDSLIQPVPEVEDVVMAPLDAAALSGAIEDLMEGMTEPEL